MAKEDGIRAYIRPETIDRYAQLVPVKIGEGVNDYLDRFMEALENGEVAIPIKAQERPRKK